MTTSRRIFVLVFTLLPLLAAQCWGLCGVPRSGAHSVPAPVPQVAQHNLPPCHNAPTEPAPSTPAPCCAVTADYAIAADTTHDFTPDPAWTTETLPAAVQLVTHTWTAQRYSVTAPPSPPSSHIVLRV